MWFVKDACLELVLREPSNSKQYGSLEHNHGSDQFLFMDRSFSPEHDGMQHNRMHVQEGPVRWESSFNDHQNAAFQGTSLQHSFWKRFVIAIAAMFLQPPELICLTTHASDVVDDFNQAGNLLFNHPPAMCNRPVSTLILTGENNPPKKPNSIKICPGPL